MCFARTGTIISLCRQIVDAEHELGRLLRLHHTREDMAQVQADVKARGGTEALRVMERLLVTGQSEPGPGAVDYCKVVGIANRLMYPERYVPGALAEAEARERVEG